MRLTCYKCRGQKKIREMGAIMVDCSVCKGVGSTEVEDTPSDLKLNERKNKKEKSIIIEEKSIIIEEKVDNSAEL